jgi:hypothetical protein
VSLPHIEAQDLRIDPYRHVQEPKQHVIKAREIQPKLCDVQRRFQNHLARLMSSQLLWIEQWADLLKALDRISEDTSRPNNSLHAHALPCYRVLHRPPHTDGENLDDLCDEFRSVSEQADGLEASAPRQI